MFIYSLKASTLKFAGVICVALITLVTLIILVPSYDSKQTDASYSVDTSVTYDKIKTNDDIVGFLSQFGWTVNKEPTESAEITTPAEFDKVFAGYNEIQRVQGLDLGKYKKKEMMRYTYEVTNYPDYDGHVLANVLVYRNKVVGGDICSAELDGFIHGFTAPKNLTPQS